MGLTFTVGVTGDVFFGTFVEQVDQELAGHFGYLMPARPSSGPYRSQEVDWFGWAQLQQMASAAIGRDSAPNLLSVEAWRGVFLPMEIEPTSIAIDEDAWLQCASLPGLLGELKQLGSASLLATDPPGLRALWEKYYTSEPDADESTEMQTYAQLMLAAQVAAERRLPLWVVK
ncbi:MAG: hypothetical protein WCD37_11460 [Chloroflexia bacterium]